MLSGPKFELLDQQLIIGINHQNISTHFKCMFPSLIPVTLTRIIALLVDSVTSICRPSNMTVTTEEKR